MKLQTRSVKRVEEMCKRMCEYYFVPPKEAELPHSEVPVVGSRKQRYVVSGAPMS